MLILQLIIYPAILSLSQLYYSKSPMNTQSLLSELSFTFSTHFASLQELFSVLTYPKNFGTVLQNVTNPQLVFALCLVLKQKIKQSNTKTALVSKIDKEKQIQAILAEHRSLFSSNGLWVQIQKSMQNKANEKKTNSFQPVNAFQIVNQEYYGKEAEVNHWCMHMNYLSLLIESLKSNKNLPNHTHTELEIMQATSKLRDEIISKLIFECLIIQEKLSKTFKVSLNDFFLSIQNSRCEDQNQLGYRLTNILSQMMNYMNNQALHSRWIRLSSKLGRQVTSLAINFFDAFSKTQSSDIINNILDVVDKLLNLDRINETPLDEKQGNLKADFKQQVYEDNQIIPSYLQSKCQKLLEMMEITLLIFQRKQNNASWQQISKINEILTIISFGYSNACQDPFSKDFKSNTQKQQVVITEIFRLFGIIAEKSFNKLQSLEDQSQIDFYYEFSFIQKIMKTIYRSMNYNFKNMGLLQFMMFSYFPLLIQKVKITFDNGGNNPINIMFVYFQKMLISLQRYNQNQPIINQIKNIFNIFILKCAQTKYQEDFEDFAQENAASYDYFKGMISFFRQLEKYAQKRQELSQFTLLYEEVDTILTSRKKGGHYLLRFILQLLRSNEPIDNNSQQIFQMMIFLLQRLKLPGYQKQYLIILDIVCDQVIDSEAYEFDLNISYLWFFIEKNRCESFDQFINKLGAQIVDILVTQKDIYFTSYCISVICRTCKKLGKVEKNRIRNIFQQQKQTPNEVKPKEKAMNYRESLIKRYFFAVYDFFTSLENSKLKELGYFDKRTQFLQIIGFLGVGTIEDVYTIFNESILKNMTAYGEESSLFFLTDTTGLIIANSKNLFRVTFIELVLDALSLNPQILASYGLQTLNNNQLYFKVFYQFIMAIQYCFQEVKFEHSTIIINFFNSIQPTISQLHTIYNTDNYQKISEIWLAYIKCGYPKMYLPLLPQKVYETKSPVAKRLLKMYYSNLFRINNIDQVLIIFRNVFERQKLDWCNYEQKMQASIVTEYQKPKILLLFADYVQISKLGYFFDYQYVIKDIVRSLYSSFLAKMSYSSGIKEVICEYDDSESQQNGPCITYVDEFFMSRTYIYSIKELARANLVLDYAAKGQEVEFEGFHEKFVEELKQMIGLQNL